MTLLVEQREARLIDALARGDREEIEDRRFDLLDALRKRQGILDALSASQSPVYGRDRNVESACWHDNARDSASPRYVGEVTPSESDG